MFLSKKKKIVFIIIHDVFVVPQSYDSFQLNYQALSPEGVLFEDPDFPANDSSLSNKNNKDIQWLRPCVSLNFECSFLFFYLFIYLLFLL